MRKRLFASKIPTDQQWMQWSPFEIGERHKLLDKCLHNDPVLRDIHRLYQLLDGKSAALFSHVSIMIAACTFLAGSPTDGHLFEKTICLISTVIYLIIAITLLRVLDFNMYDLKLNTSNPKSLFCHASPDPYDNDTDKVFEELREYFSVAIKKRGIAHKKALNRTSFFTKSMVIFVLIDVVVRVLFYIPEIYISLSKNIAALHLW